ncbi:MAG: type II toxin-antitoxin system RelE/ParE family toxin [Verrucomicrobiota bacterium]
MSYEIEVGTAAARQIDALDAVTGVSVERKILWLGQNAKSILHRRLTGMPDDLGRLCKLRIGDYRILYWVYHEQKLIRIYRVRHRSEVYRAL